MSQSGQLSPVCRALVFTRSILSSRRGSARATFPFARLWAECAPKWVFCSHSRAAPPDVPPARVEPAQVVEPQVHLVAERDSDRALARVAAPVAAPGVEVGQLAGAAA